MARMGQETVDAAGTAQAISTARVMCELVFVNPLPGNVGNIAIGDSTVSMSNGFVMAPTDPPVPQFVKDVAQIYVDADNNDDGVSWIVAG